MLIVIQPINEPFDNLANYKKLHRKFLENNNTNVNIKIRYTL